MTVVEQFPQFEAATPALTETPDAPNCKVEETYWGYVVHPVTQPSVLLTVAQSAAWLVGISALIAALGLWVMPAMAFGAGALGMRLGATVIVLSVAAFCLLFASRGSAPEVQVDTKLGEIREVVRNRAGRSTVLNRYGFDAIGSVFIEHLDGVARDPNATGAVTLRFGKTSVVMQVAVGPMSVLGPLRDRLGRDMMLSPSGPRRAPIPAPRFERDAA